MSTNPWDRSWPIAVELARCSIEDRFDPAAAANADRRDNITASARMSATGRPRAPSSPCAFLQFAEYRTDFLIGADAKPDTANVGLVQNIAR
jgi:hypothetical protein